MRALAALQKTRKGQSIAASLERRVEALEAHKGQALRWVFQYQNETADEAKQREGVQPGECVIVVTWEDVKL